MRAKLKGWYADPDNPTAFRYWDGEQWTEDRRDSVDDIADAAVDETNEPASLGRRVFDAAANATQSVFEAAKDPARLKKVAAMALPAVDATLDGAGVRNKKGEIKLWRVARAAVRPRKTISRVGVEMRGTVPEYAAMLRTTDGETIHPTDEEILGEWDLAEPTLALAHWREGTERFAAADEADDDELRASALLMCELLCHCLIAAPILDNDDPIIDTVGDTLAVVLNATHDEQWDDEAEKIVRLALAVTRRFGVQPEELGGNGELDGLFDYPRSRMRMAMSVAPTKWSCDLAAWFAAGPQDT